MRCCVFCYSVDEPTSHTVLRLVFTSLLIVVSILCLTFAILALENTVVATITGFTAKDTLCGVDYKYSAFLILEFNQTVSSQNLLCSDVLFELSMFCAETAERAIWKAQESYNIGQQISGWTPIVGINRTCSFVGFTPQAVWFASIPLVVLTLIMVIISIASLVTRCHRRRRRNNYDIIQ